MRRLRWEASVALLALVLFGTPSVGRGESVTPVRTSDPGIAKLIADGADHSPTFAGLLERLDPTGWLVFVQRGSCPDRVVAACLLHTVGRFEGQPYFRVVLQRWPGAHPHREIATLGHELQHVLEAAEAPEVIDAVSLAGFFRRTGYVSVTSRASKTFETAAARRVEGEVLREMQGKRRSPWP